ncbi:hypothetical protein JCM11491_000669 [Sporobolomyces phaffii]
MQLALASGAGPLAHLASTSNATTRPNKTTARSVPAFLNKLFTMVSDPTTDDLIRWSDDGDSFLVPSADKFGKELLPRFFKHSNFGSFVRQLNMYGFHKVPHLTQGVLKSDGGESPELLEFTNPNFARAQPDLLFFIRRQKAKGDSNNPASASSGSNRNNSNNSLAGPSGTSASASTSTSSALDLPSLLTDLSAIRKHQTAISADLKDLQQSNQLLWQEALASREKHRKQEDTINKILRFLAGVFGGQVLDTSGTNGSASAAASPGADSNAESVGSEAGDATTGGNRKGKGKAKAPERGVVGFPKGRSRLLLEDVKGRQQERAAALRELDESDDDQQAEDDDEDEEIEEIPVLQREDERFPTISSSSHASSLPAHQPPPPTALTRTNSGSNALTSPNRFTSLPPASPSPSNPFSNLDFSSFSPETMQQFLAAAGGGGANDPNSFAALFSNNNNNSGSSAIGSGGSANTGHAIPSHSSGGGGSSSSALSLAPSASNCFDFGGGAMIPTSSSAFHPTTTSNPLDFGHSPTSALAPTSFPTYTSSAPALSPSLVSSINDHDEILRSVINEKQDIDRRTTELEDQISRLLKNLPEETRDQVLENDGPLGTASGLGTAVEEKGGFDWGTATGENGELDLDKLLEQFSFGADPRDSIAANAPTPQATHSTPGNPGEVDPSLTSMDYSAFFPDPSTSDSATINNPLYQSTTGSLPFPSDVDANPIEFPYEVTSPQNGPSPARSFTAGSPARKKSATGGRKRKSDVLSPLGEGVAASPGREGTRRSSRRKT